ncbi:iron complex outermembrane recepter protein [Vibrio xiamenensis]|uniref:Iron complex outermembrane recepter protein n=1 Tax=Vibrio xiamenensis TaxID=861298 RepID=A0A1G7YWK9_9VIBR|nr:TonB-dependent receptor [Vibrio xiamenensis]SDH00656.1 iron complex outermembrane recepter protein [Vibrio xiamenensis]
MKRRRYILTSLVLVTGAVHATDDLQHLMSMTLEELSMLETEMKTASRFTQKLTDIPSSVYVITQERIKRSGARSISELLSLVPGINVSNFSDTEQTVSIRGFHDGLYNKMLVLLDGRSLNSPVYGGVYWADVDYILDDIERIEVLRGPGGTMWGGNAVNGVVNIITKSADKTQSNLLAMTVDKNGEVIANVRSGLKLSDGVYGRAFYKQRNEKNTTKGDYQNWWRRDVAGIVLESQQESDSWTLRFGANQSHYRLDFPKYNIDQTTGTITGVEADSGIVNNRSAYVHFTYDHALSLNLKANYGVWVQHDHDQRFDAPASYTDYNLESNFVYRPSDELVISYGGAYRLYDIDFATYTGQYSLYEYPSNHRIYNLSHAQDGVSNVYLQSEKWLTSNWKLLAGVKLEYFELASELELSPQLRALYRFDDNVNSLWVGIARSVTAPSYLDRNSLYFLATRGSDTEDPALIVEMGNSNMDTERVITSEIGHRYASDALQFDSTLFFSSYSNVRGSAYTGDIDGYANSYLYQTSDQYSVESYGFEWAAKWQLTQDLSLYTNYSFLHADDYRRLGGMQAIESDQTYSIESQQNLSVQTLWNITPQWQLDVSAKGQRIRYPTDFNYSVPDYISFNARLAWQQRHDWPQVELIFKDIGHHSGYYQDAYQQFATYQSSYLRVSYAF